MEFKNETEKKLYIADCTNRFIKEMNTTGDVKRLLDLAYEILGQPMMLVDISMCFIAQVGGESVKDEPFWDWILINGYVKEDYTNMIMEDEISSEEKFVWEYGMENHRQLVVKIFQNGTPLGYLKMLEYNGPITDLDKEILDNLSNLISIMMSGGQNKLKLSNSKIEKFLTALVDRKILDESEIKERVMAMNLRLYKNLYMVAIEPVAKTELHVEQIYLLKRKLHNILNRSTIFIYENRLVVLYDTDANSIQEDFALGQLKSVLRQYKLRAGISNVFTDLALAADEYENAEDALFVASKLELKEAYTFFSEHTLDQLILNYAKDKNPKYLMHPAIRELEQIDREKNSDYVISLLTYIREGQNLTKAAKNLHIHHNTLKYR
ncbi:MAG: helix-turn-helix domain-containing protein, partial [Pseudobutyrivibrio sp.]|nr:helix-turn-helix domain-containing protein [Pseudobutyrivibrio sp.]